MLMTKSMCAILSALTLSTLAADRPNILFAIADDISHAGAYGKGHQFVKTPVFDRIAKQGILYRQAYTPSSKCAPSRSVVITGRNPWQLEEAANHWPTFPEKFKSVVEALGEHGYVTGFTGKGWGPGNAQGRELTGKEYNKLKVTDKPAQGIYSGDYTANFIAFMEDKPADKPFFFWYGSKEAHRGYEFKSGEKNGKSFDDLDFNPRCWGDSNDVRHDILDYAVEVEYNDMHLGRILMELENRGELENTLIIATSDNSMPFPRFKGHPYANSCHLPFAVMWSGHITNPGREYQEYISFIDLAPTFLEAAGVTEAQAGMQPIEGRSLFDTFRDEHPEYRNRVITGRERHDLGRPNDESYPVRSLIKGRYTYMHNFEPDRWPCCDGPAFRDTDGSPTKKFALSQGPGSLEYETCFGKRPMQELYDLKVDPECINNLTSNPEYKEIMQAMKKELFDELTRQQDPRMFGKGHLFDEYEYFRRPKTRKPKKD